MSGKRVSMRKIKECLRLKFTCGLSHERIALALSLSKNDAILVGEKLVVIAALQALIDRQEFLLGFRTAQNVQDPRR